MEIKVRAEEFHGLRLVPFYWRDGEENGEEGEGEEGRIGGGGGKIRGGGAGVGGGLSFPLPPLFQ